MAEPTRAEFMQSIGLTPEPAVAVTNAPVAPLASELTLPPATAQALNKQAEKLERNRLDVSASTSDFSAKIGARAGIPMDMESGISFMSRLRTAAQPTPEEEVKALEAAYGPGKVRRNQYGWLIVEKPDEKGRPTDVLVDPIGVDVGDLASVVAAAPEFMGGILAAAATGGASRLPGILNAAKTLIAMAGGAAVGGATKDVLVRTAEDEPIQPGEIGERRAKMAVVDLALGTALGTGAKVVGKGASPFSSSGPIQFNAREAQDFFQNKYGVRLSLTPAESTGNSFLQRAEAMEMQKPGASVPFEKLLKARETQLSELQRLALGGAVPDEELAGQRALAALGARTAPLEMEAQRAAAETRTAAQRELTSGVGPRVDKTVVGQNLSDRAEAIRQAYRTERDRRYGIVESDPRTQVKNISGNDLANEADRLLGRQVSVQRQVPGPILGPNGQPIPVTTTEVLEEFSEEGIIPKIRALQRGRGQDFRLDELIRMRRAIDNDIARGEAIPGVQTRELGQLRTALTTRIQTGLDAIDPNLRAAWQDANDYVAREVGQFNQTGIKEIFKDAEQSGYLGPTAIVDRVTSGGSKAQDTYRAYREFFGAGSNEMRGIQQAIRDEVFGQDRIEGFIDAKGFARRVTQLAKDAPAAFDDAFGATAASLRNSARALDAAQGGNLPQEELIAAVNSGNLSGSRLQQMLSAQAVKDTAYRNELVKAVSEGNLKGDSIKPTEFVNRVIFKKDTQPQDVQGIVGLLQDRPDVLEDIRRITFQKVLDNATSVAPGTGKRTLVANDIESTLSDPQMVKRLQTALGSSTYEDLVRLKDFLKPGAVVQQAAKSAGGLSTGSQVAGLVERGALQYVDRAIKNFFIATVYTAAPVRALISNNVIGPQGQARLVNYVIASTPFVEAVSKTFTEQEAKKVMVSLKESVDRFSQEQPQEATATDQPMSREDFMRSLETTTP